MWMAALVDPRQHPWVSQRSRIPSKGNLPWTRTQKYNTNWKEKHRMSSCGAYDLVWKPWRCTRSNMCLTTKIISSEKQKCSSFVRTIPEHKNNFWITFSRIPKVCWDICMKVEESGRRNFFTAFGCVKLLRLPVTSTKSHTALFCSRGIICSQSDVGGRTLRFLKTNSWFQKRFPKGKVVPDLVGDTSWQRCFWCVHVPLAGEKGDTRLAADRSLLQNNASVNCFFWVMGSQESDQKLFLSNVTIYVFMKNVQPSTHTRAHTHSHTQFFFLHMNPYIHLLICPSVCIYPLWNISDSV